MAVIANTTVLSNYAAAGQLELLRRLWGKVYVPDQVYDEIQEGLRCGYDFYTGIDQLMFPFSETGWLHLIALQSPDEFRSFGELVSTLQSGEAACLSIAYHRRWTFLSDDKAARDAADTLKVPVSGTLGVLLALVKRHQLALSEADAALQCMRRAGYYSPVALLDELLQD